MTSRNLSGRVLSAVVLFAAASVLTTASAKTYKLRIGSGHSAENTTYVKILRDFFVPEVEKRVKAETGDEVKFTEAYAGVVASPFETLKAVENGVLDIGAYCACFEQSRLFTHSFPYWVPFSSPDPLVTTKATHKVYEEFPELTKVFGKYNQTFLAISGYGNYGLGTKAPWQTVDDLKGIKIGAAGPNLAWLPSTVTGVSTSIPEAYNALLTGVYDGWLMFPANYYNNKAYEVAKYYKEIDFGTFQVNVMTINNNTLKRLPPAIVKIIKEVSLAYETEQAKEIARADASALKALSEKANVSKLSPEERAKWTQMVRDFPKRMALEGEKRGMPARKIVKAYIQAQKDLGYQFPVDYNLD